MQKIRKLDLSNFNTSNVTQLAGMFLGCSKLKEIKGLNNFSIINVKDMKFMFHRCFELVFLDLSSFNTSNIINMQKCFMVAIV